MSLWSRIAEAVAKVGVSVAEYLAAMARPRAPEKSLAFTIGMIALAAKMAKADGIVTADEIAAFRRIFHIPAGDLKNVARVFNLAKQDVAGYDAYARQIARLFHDKPRMLEDILDGLFHISKADGAVHERELAFLDSVARIFGFAERDFARIRARHVAIGSVSPYAVLGIDAAASDAEIKTAYRKLARIHHPDRHIAAGMPPEAIKIATDRIARINDAYAEIEKARGF